MAEGTSRQGAAYLFLSKKNASSLLSRLGSTTPLCHTDIYILPMYAGVMRHKKHLLMPIADQIEEIYGEVAESTQIDIFASEIHEPTATLLKVDVGSPGLTVARRYANSDGTIFEVAFGVHAANRYTHSFRLKREPRANGRAATKPVGAERKNI